MASLERDERAWLRRAQDGSVSDLEALLRSRWPRAYRAAYLITLDHARAEETVLEALLACVRALGTLDDERPFAPALHRAVVGRALDAASAEDARLSLRGESIAGSADLDDWVAPPYADPGAWSLRTGLRRLTPVQRAVVVLRYLLEYPSGQVAGLLDLPRPVAESHRRRALDTLREHFPDGLRERDLLGMILQQPVPDEHVAEERAWTVVQAAFLASGPTVRQRRRRGGRKALLLLAVGGAVAAVALTPAWDRIADELRGWLEEEPPAASAPQKAAAAVGEVPGGGRLLVRAGGRLLIVEPGGRLVAAGEYDGGVWSPAGDAVLAWRGDRLDAVGTQLPDDVRWSAEVAGASGAAWSATGELVAYESAGAVRVAGADRGAATEIVEGAAGVVPAWRPSGEPALAFADRDGRVIVVGADGRRLWRTPRAPVPTEVQWSSDGGAILVAAAHRVALIGFREGPRTVVSVPAGTGTVSGASMRPGTDEFVYSVFDPAGRQTTVTLVDGERSRTLVSLPGRLPAPVWSPDGSLLAVSWPEGDQWLFLPADGAGAASTEIGVTAAIAAGGFPEIAGWCCYAAPGESAAAG